MRPSPPEGGTGMVNNVPSAKDFIMSTYNPRVAVLASPAVDLVMAKSNLTFVDLIRPFTKVSTDVLWSEPLNGQLISPKGIKFSPVDISSWKPGDIDSQKNKKQLSSIVAQYPPPLVDPLVDHLPSPKTCLYNLGTLKASTTSSYSVEVPSSSPWFEKWRDMFLRLQSESHVSQYDFLHHFMACILVISSAEAKTQEELNAAIDRLNKMQQQHQSEWPNTWTFASVLKFYLIVHEKSVVDQASAESMYQSIRTTYGGNFCYMLQLQGPLAPASAESNIAQCADVWSNFFRDETIKLEDGPEENHVAEKDVIVNSELLHPLSPDLEQPPTIVTLNGNAPISIGTPSKPIVRGKCLVDEDLQNIQATVDDFITKALLPYVERQSRLLHESIVNRRGMSKSFFSATKRLFGTGAKAASSVFYAPDSLEMMSRKLADVYFLFGHYAGSYQLYHQLKKDFLGDSAYAYFASSLEMAAVSHFMMSQIEPPLAMARAFPVHYISDAISHYVDHCRMMDAATKCALICCECLRKMDNNGEAATIYIRMTSEECDLRSALMLEQAAYTFLRLNSPRKYALHCVLAGHRYSKAGFRKHSLNCYFQAAQVYKGKGWRFAEDHVNFTIARHQNLLQMSNSSISKHLQSLLVTPSPQPSHQIQGFYKEYLTIMNKFDPHGTIRREFFIPKVLCSLIRVRIAVYNLLPDEITFSSIPEDNIQMWDSLEDQVVRDCVNSSVIIFKPSRVLFHSKSDNTLNPQVPCDESFYVEVPLQNPLCIPLSLRDIRLHFNSDNVKSSTVHELELHPEETKMVRFAVCASSQGVLSYEWLYYDLELSSLRVPFKHRIVLKGPRLNSTITERVNRVYAKDLRNQIRVVEKMPLLQAQIENIPGTLYHAQSSEFSLVLKDVTEDSSQRKRVTNFVLAMDNMDESLAIHSSSQDKSNHNQLDIISIKKNFANFRASPEGTNGCRLPCLYKAPQSGEHAILNMLLVYAFNSDNSTNKLHRIIKITVKIPLTNCLKLQFSTLKLLNANTFVGLLKTHNLTPESTITIQKISFNREELSIVSSYRPALTGADSTGENSCVPLAAMASRNTILKVQVNEEKVLSDPTFILVEWQVSNSVRKDNNIVSGCNKIQLNDIKKILSVEENTLIFELRHKSRIQNDFSVNPCLIFPVQLLVHSRTEGRVTIHIDRALDPNSTATSPGQKASKDTLAFIGQTSWVLDIHRMTSYPIDFTVAITYPGVYNIGPTLITTSESVPSPTSTSTSLVPTHRKYILHSPLIVTQDLQ